MKKLVLLMTALALGEAMLPAQTVDFNNYNIGFGINAPVYDTSGTPLGSGFLGQLYVGASEDKLVAAGSPVPFRNHPTTGQGTGYLIAGAVTGPSIWGDAYCQLRAWDSSGGSSYEQAVAAGKSYGSSGTIRVSTVAEISFPAVLTGLKSFNLQGSLPLTCTLTLASSPPQGGFVETTPSPVNGQYGSGAVVTLTAKPAANYQFNGWSGDAQGADPTIQVTMSWNLSVVANFVPQFQVSVSAQPGGGGTVTGGGTYASGTSVTVTATANGGYQYAHWVEAGVVVSQLANYPFTISGNRTLIAVFCGPPPSITSGPTVSPGNVVAVGGSFTLSVTAAGTGPLVYAWRQNGVTLMTTAEGSATFKNVTASQSGTYDVVASNPDGGSVTSGAIQVTVTATVPQSQVTVSASPANGGTVVGGGSYNNGASVTVAATANSGYAFVNWMEGGIVMSASATYTFSATQSRTLVAQFTRAGTCATASLACYQETVRSEVSLISYYTFDARNVLDSRSSNHGTLANSIDYHTGVGGGADQALVLTGAGHVNLGAVGAFEFASGHGTVEAWVRSDWTSNPGYNPAIFANRDGGNVNWSIHMTAGKDTAGLWNGPAYLPHTLPEVGTRWHHLAVVFEADGASGGSPFTLYWDGNPVGTTAQTPSGVRGLPTELGSVSVVGQERWIGALDEVAFYSEALSAGVVKAHYTALVGTQAYVLTLNSGPGGAIEASPAPLNGRYAAGTVVTLTTKPVPGYQFSAWGGNASGASTSTQVTMNGNLIVTAAFTPLVVTYTLTASASPTDGGLATGGGTYPSGANVTVNASANNGYQFAHWTEAGTVVSALASYSFSVAGNRTLVAVFKAAPPNLAGSLTVAPGNVVNGGGSFTLNIAATGAGPLSYAWRQNQKTVATTVEGTVTFNNVTASQSGIYDVVVSNAGGSVQSTAIQVTVNAPAAPPNITSGPTVSPGNVVSAGGAFTLSVTATGTGPLSYAWRQNQNTVATTAEGMVTFHNVTANQSGIYDVVVSNAGGSVQSTAILVTVQEPTTPTNEVVYLAGLRRQIYTNILGLAVADLRASLKFPLAPDVVDSVAGGESQYLPNDAGENYGQRLTGWLVPSQSGNYVFYLAADDQAQVYLSPDDNPAHKQLLVEEPGWSTWRDWESSAQNPSRVSASIPLLQDQHYFLEVLHKEGTGGDHVALAWELPGGTAPHNGDPPIGQPYLVYRSEMRELILTVRPEGSGSITVDPPPPVGGLYTDGTALRLTARGAAGYQFTGWGGALAGTANPASLTTSGSQEVRAQFELVLSDVTQPGDQIVPTSNNSPDAERALRAIDNSTATKYLNFDKLNTGFTVTPRVGWTIVSGLGLTSANDMPQRDPASFKLEGSSDGQTFSLIASGAVPVFTGRFQQKNLFFTNATAYRVYRLTFPTVANAVTADSMQIGEVQLFGQVAPPLSLSISQWAGQVILMWSEGRLQQAEAVSGPYQDVLSARSPYAFSSPTGTRFFRLAR